MPDAVAQRQVSMLLPSLFEGLDDSSRLTVLNFGPPCQHTLDFFSDYKCRLYFTDLADEALIDDDGEPLTGAALTARLSSILALPDSARIDLCLFWDVLNYLDAKQLKALFETLAPNLHGLTRAHGFGVRSANMRLEPLRYGIQDEQTLSLQTRPDGHPPAFAHTQASLKRLLSGMDIGKVLLMPDGRLEMLFFAVASAGAPARAPAATELG